MVTKIWVNIGSGIDLLADGTTTSPRGQWIQLENFLINARTENSKNFVQVSGFVYPSVMTAVSLADLI